MYGYLPEKSLVEHVYVPDDAADVAGPQPVLQANRHEASGFAAAYDREIAGEDRSGETSFPDYTSNGTYNYGEPLPGPYGHTYEQGDKLSADFMAVSKEISALEWQLQMALRDVRLATDKRLREDAIERLAPIVERVAQVIDRLPTRWLEG